MRIAVLFPEPSEFSRSTAEVSLGSGESDDLKLQAAGVLAGHARIRHDARGYVLEVGTGGGVTHVNARPVRQRALLHPGDHVSLGTAQILLLGEHVREACTPETRPDAVLQPGALALRGVSGARSGAVLVVAPTLELGPDGLPCAACEGAPHVVLMSVAGRPALRTVGLSPEDWPRINGHPVASVWLQDGDQIAIGGQRYLLDAPADAARGDSARLSMVPPEAAQPEDTAGSRREVRWLLLTAAAIALIMVMLLALRH